MSLLEEIWTRMHTERRGCEESQGEGSHLQAKEKKPQKKATLPTPWSWTSKPAPREEINVCCLSHPACGTCYGSPSRLTHQEIGAEGPISGPRSQRRSHSQDENSGPRRLSSCHLTCSLLLKGPFAYKPAYVKVKSPQEGKKRLPTWNYHHRLLRF